MPAMPADRSDVISVPMALLRRWGEQAKCAQVALDLDLDLKDVAIRARQLQDLAEEIFGAANAPPAPADPPAKPLGYAAYAAPWGPAPDCQTVHVEGPGMPRFANHLIVSHPADVNSLLRLLAHAYEAGAAARGDVRAAIGLPRDLPGPR